MSEQFKEIKYFKNYSLSALESKVKNITEQIAGLMETQVCGQKFDVTCTITHLVHFRGIVEEQIKSIEKSK